MGIPYGRFTTDLCLQRRQDAMECLELRILTSDETRRVCQGLLKQDMMYVANRVGFPLLVYLFYKGRLLEGGRHLHMSIPRVILGDVVAFNYLDLGDYLGADLMWHDVKYVYFKYEPIIRKLRKERHPNFQADPSLG